MAMSRKRAKKHNVDSFFRDIELIYQDKFYEHINSKKNASHKEAQKIAANFVSPKAQGEFEILDKKIIIYLAKNKIKPIHTIEQEKYNLAVKKQSN